MTTATPTRKVAVVTGSRADYGLLQATMRRIQERPGLDLQVVVTGAHLSVEFGLTADAVENDGFTLHTRVPLPLADTSPGAIAASMAACIQGCSAAFERDRPDIVLVLGDRYEVLAAAQTCLVHRIPLAHIHGGEITVGAIDDSMRHATTKMSHLHFVATEEFRRRVIQLGEVPEHVYNVGAPGIDNIFELTLLSRSEVCSALGIPASQPIFLLTVHPETLADGPPTQGLDAVLSAIEQFPGVTVVATKANADMDGSELNRRLATWTGARPGSAFLFASLGQLRYLSLLKQAAVVIGNSSSGIIEAPALAVPTVNVGSRQAGRPRSPSVVDCPPETGAVTEAVRLATSAAHRANCDPSFAAYGGGHASEKIVDILSSVNLRDILRKRFFDLGLGVRG